MMATIDDAIASSSDDDFYLPRYDSSTQRILSSQKKKKERKKADPARKRQTAKRGGKVTSERESGNLARMPAANSQTKPKPVKLEPAEAIVIEDSDDEPGEDSQPLMPVVRKHAPIPAEGKSAEPEPSKTTTSRSMFDHFHNSGAIDLSMKSKSFSDYPSLSNNSAVVDSSVAKAQRRRSEGGRPLGGVSLVKTPSQGGRHEKVYRAADHAPFMSIADDRNTAAETATDTSLPAAFRKESVLGLRQSDAATAPVLHAGNDSTVRSDGIAPSARPGVPQIQESTTFTALNQNATLTSSSTGASVIARCDTVNQLFNSTSANRDADTSASLPSDSKVQSSPKFWGAQKTKPSRLSLSGPKSLQVKKELFDSQHYEQPVTENISVPESVMKSNEDFIEKPTRLDHIKKEMGMEAGRSGERPATPEMGVRVPYTVHCSPISPASSQDPVPNDVVQCKNVNDVKRITSDSRVSDVTSLVNIVGIASGQSDHGMRNSISRQLSNCSSSDQTDGTLALETDSVRSDMTSQNVMSVTSEGGTMDGRATSRYEALSARAITSKLGAASETTKVTAPQHELARRPSMTSETSPTSVSRSTSINDEEASAISDVPVAIDQSPPKAKEKKSKPEKKIIEPESDSDSDSCDLELLEEQIRLDIEYIRKTAEMKIKGFERKRQKLKPNEKGKMRVTDSQINLLKSQMELDIAEKECHLDEAMEKKRKKKGRESPDSVQNLNVEDSASSGSDDDLSIISSQRKKHRNTEFIPVSTAEKSPTKPGSDPISRGSESPPKPTNSSIVEVAPVLTAAATTATSTRGESTDGNSLSAGTTGLITSKVPSTTSTPMPSGSTAAKFTDSVTSFIDLPPGELRIDDSDDDGSTANENDVIDSGDDDMNADMAETQPFDAAEEDDDDEDLFQTQPFVIDSDTDEEAVNAGPYDPEIDAESIISEQLVEVKLEKLDNEAVKIKQEKVDVNDTFAYSQMNSEIIEIDDDSEDDFMREMSQKCIAPESEDEDDVLFLASYFEEAPTSYVELVIPKTEPVDPSIEAEAADEKVLDEDEDTNEIPPITSTEVPPTEHESQEVTKTPPITETPGAGTTIAPEISRELSPTPCLPEYGHLVIDSQAGGHVEMREQMSASDSDEELPEILPKAEFKEPESRDETAIRKESAERPEASLSVRTASTDLSVSEYDRLYDVDIGTASTTESSDEDVIRRRRKPPKTASESESSEDESSDRTTSPELEEGEKSSENRNDTPKQFLAPKLQRMSSSEIKRYVRRKSKRKAEKEKKKLFNDETLFSDEKSSGEEVEIDVVNDFQKISDRSVELMDAERASSEDVPQSTSDKPRLDAQAASTKHVRGEPAKETSKYFDNKQINDNSIDGDKRNVPHASTSATEEKKRKKPTHERSDVEKIETPKEKPERERNIFSVSFTAPPTKTHEKIKERKTETEFTMSQNERLVKIRKKVYERKIYQQKETKMASPLHHHKGRTKRDPVTGAYPKLPSKPIPKICKSDSLPSSESKENSATKMKKKSSDPSRLVAPSGSSHISLVDTDWLSADTGGDTRGQSEPFVKPVGVGVKRRRVDKQEEKKRRRDESGLEKARAELAARCPQKSAANWRSKNEDVFTNSQCDRLSAQAESGPVAEVGQKRARDPDPGQAASPAKVAKTTTALARGFQSRQASLASMVAAAPAPPKPRPVKSTAGILSMRNYEAQAGPQTGPQTGPPVPKKRVTFSSDVHDKQQRCLPRPAILDHRAEMVIPAPAKTDTRLDLSMDHFLSRVLAWNTKWLHEHSAMSSLQQTPPIVGPEELYRAQDTYSSYDEYFKTMFPLMLVEMWEAIHTCWENTGRKNVRIPVYVSSASMTNKQKQYRILDWNCVAIRPENQEFFKENDLINFEATTPSGSLDVFGFVDKLVLAKNEDRRVIDLLASALSKDTVNYKVMSFRVRVQYCRSAGNSEVFRLVERTVQHVSHVANLTQFCRQYTALSLLSRNGIARDLLRPVNMHVFTMDPTPNDYRLQRKYNKHQTEVILRASLAVQQGAVLPKIVLLQGPPGTGKSYTVIAIIRRILQTQPASSRGKILLCAPSNAAVDVIIKRMLRMGLGIVNSSDESCFIRLVRMGNLSTVHPSVRQHSMEHRLDQLREQDFEETDSKTTSAAKSVSELDREMVEKMKDHHKASQEQRYRDARELAMSIEQLRQRIAEIKSLRGNMSHTQLQLTVLRDCDVICCTLNHAGSLREVLQASVKDTSQGSRKITFTCAIVDEACQALEIETLIPLQYIINKLILVGDPKQLGPTVVSKKAEEHFYSTSLFSRLYRYLHMTYEALTPVYMLVKQYRMHRQILAFPNHKFYHNKLETDRNLELELDKSPFQPYLVFDLQSSENAFDRRDDSDKCTESGRNSRYNTAECRFIVKLCEFILTRNTHIRARDIGIITFYARQKLKMREMLKEMPRSVCEGRQSEVDVFTVDGFQGGERKIIIMSCVRAQTGRGQTVGFLESRNRLCVALTRAQYALWIVGHVPTLKSDAMWREMMEDAMRRNVVVSRPDPRQFEKICLKPVNKPPPNPPESAGQNSGQSGHVEVHKENVGGTRGLLDIYRVENTNS